MMNACNYCGRRCPVEGWAYCSFECAATHGVQQTPRVAALAALTARLVAINKAMEPGAKYWPTTTRPRLCWSADTDADAWSAQAGGFSGNAATPEGAVQAVVAKARAHFAELRAKAADAVDDLDAVMRKLEWL